MLASLPSKRSMMSCLFAALLLAVLFGQSALLLLSGEAYAQVAEAAIKPVPGKTTEALRIERLNRPKVFVDLPYGDVGQMLDLCMPAETNTAQLLPATKAPSAVPKSAVTTQVKPAFVKAGSPVQSKPQTPKNTIAPSKPLPTKLVSSQTVAGSKKNIKRTAVIFVHGGNFKFGNKEQLQPYCKLFAQAGFLSVSINYRLSGTKPFPAAQEDVEDAVVWVQSKASHYGFDPKRVVIVGYSAGGNLALMASTRINMAYKPAKPQPVTVKSASQPTKPVSNLPVYPVAGVISMAAPTNLETLISAVPNLKPDMQKYLDGANPKSASPLFSATAKSSPTFLIHGQQDVLVPPAQSKEYQELLQELKVPVKLQTYTGMDHNLFKATPQLTQMLRDMTAFLLYVENKQLR